MLKKISLALLFAALAAVASAQEKTVTVADFAGTWNIEMMSHQIALVIEPTEGNKVDGTLMLMGRDTLLKGELTDRTITFVGVKSEANGNVRGNQSSDHDHQPPTAAPAGSGMPPQPIAITLQEDGTIAGEMMTNNGPMKWTGEKLKSKKKG
jgi:hypothetical protein